MATYKIGQAAIVPKGEYSAETQYTRLDAVTANGGTWLCKADCKGVHPVTGSNHATYWQLMADGLTSVTAETPADGQEKLTFKLAGGTETSHSFNVYVPADNSLDLATKMTGTLPIANGGTGSTSASGARSALGAQAKHIKRTATLAAGVTEWTVSVSSVTTSNSVIVSPAPESWSVWQDCEIRCTAQGTSSLSFKAESAPDTAVNVNVIILS